MLESNRPSKRSPIKPRVAYLAVIDGHHERFQRLRTGQAAYEEQHKIVNEGPPLHRATKEQRRKELRQTVVETIERFLWRCRREGFVTEETLIASLARFES